MYHNAQWVERARSPRPSGYPAAPRVRSMREYILLHYQEDLRKALCAWINGDSRDAVSQDGFPEDPIRACPFAILESCGILDMTFWRDTPFTMTAILRMHLDVRERTGGKFRIERREYDAEARFDMTDGIVCEIRAFWPHGTRIDADGWKLSDYLIPILRKDEIEAGAEALLTRYYPEAYSEPKEKDALLLAQRMGLDVIRLPLYKRDKTRSMLIFRESLITFKQEGREGTRANERPYDVLIPGNTIVINTAAVHKDRCQLEIYHECIHYDWHFLFYRLQDMHNNDVRRREPSTLRQRKYAMDPLIWAEWQARRGSFGLMMPLSVMRPIVFQKLGDMPGQAPHMGEKLDRIGRASAREHCLPKFRVRARLIQMGYIAARGALNYVNDRYIEPFAFRSEQGSGEYTFVVDRKSAYEEYLRNEDFRARMDSGRYAYVDGHICLRGARYITDTSSGMRLTRWANAHVDACCLRFMHVFERDPASEYLFGAFNSDEEYNNHYLTFAEVEEGRSREEQLADMSRLLDSLPNTFHELLERLMRLRKITIEQMEEKSCLSARTISRLRTEERRAYTLDQVIAICVALRLPPWLSNELLSRAGLTLRAIPLHRAYRFVLDCLFMDSVADVQKFLEANGQPPLNLKTSL